jgi:hypothetical protein
MGILYCRSRWIGDFCNSVIRGWPAWGLRPATSGLRFELNWSRSPAIGKILRTEMVNALADVFGRYDGAAR